ncbi:TIGR03503 family protein [Vibrio rhizosphaerae]|uniref:TIGR03503 family protein n=1 Tax=Vibrio rhizosphaerae TaxID=398736 RepID=A0ABU4IW21_9VIBR|nr:TIGR03503 family protein [Vibrio rhizosphaerae]MDW6093607.1 TIGR03503 family protein [Vibrio rhizosphaerae]
MLRVLTIFIGLWVSLGSYAATNSPVSLLDNRVRVDPTISQITFVIYREKPSKPVVLVRPDGTKYYSWRHPDNVRWYQEPSMDIISIDKPMPGPWQAVGKVTPKNNIRLISNLALTTDQLPLRLYQGEEIKFTARLTSDDKPLTIRDFLERVKLKVTFTKYIENEAQLVKEARPTPDVIGEFADDGRGLDEKPGDGVFTVKLKIFSEPGRYRARITSGNGVFLRAQEQEVLVYPSPITTSFIQSRVDGQPHQVVFTGLEGTIEPGSVIAHVDHWDRYDNHFTAEGQADRESLTVKLTIPNDGEVGNFKWNGRVYATEVNSQRPLIFPISEHTYSVVEDVNIEQTRLMQERALAEKVKQEQQEAILQQRESARKWKLIYIVLGNIGALILGLVIWTIVRKRKAQKMPLQLDMPKK